MLTLIKKELKTNLMNPYFYFMGFLFTFLVGIIFFNLFVSYVDNIQNIPQLTGELSFINNVVLKAFANINFLFLFFVPIFTMKSWSEEREKETIHLFRFSPMTSWEIVISKFVAYSILNSFILFWATLFPAIFMGNFLQEKIFVVTCMVGLGINLLLFTALSQLASIFSKSTIISAMLGFILILFFWMLTWFAKGTSEYIIMEISSYLSMMVHFETLSKGILSTSDFAYFLSFLFFILFLIKRRYEGGNL